MSGVEALAAFGIACNVFQTISFGRDAISLIKAIYETGSFDPTLGSRAAFLGAISDELESQLQGLPSSGLSKDQARLLDVTKTCRTVYKCIQDEVKFLSDDAAKGKLAATLKLVAKTSWRKRRLTKLERQLGDVEKMMQAGLLVRIQ